MDRGVWWTTVYEVTRVRHNLASEQRQQLIWHSTKIHNLYFSILVSLFQIPISLPPHAFFFNLI